MLKGKSFIRMLVLAILLANASMAIAADATRPPSTVAILPFNMHTPSDLNYLQNGIRDMLTSRLAWQGKVQVIDRSAVDGALRGSKSDLTLDDALRVGRSLKADYVLFGSLTALGQSISIDAKMAPTAGSTEPVSLVSQTKSLDDVIPQINRFAQDVNQKIFARPGEQAQVASSESESSSNRNPEFLLPDSLLSGEKLSYLNPNFVEVTPEGSIRQPGLWRSQTFQGGIVGMDVGDLDGDGKPEMVTVTSDKLTVLKKEGQALRTVATYSAGKVDHFLTVSVVDVDRDGRSEICVTNLRKKNTIAPGSSDSVTGTRGFIEDVASLVMSFSGSKVQPIAQNVSYFLNGVEFPGRGKILIGQEKGQTTEGPFKGGIYEMQLRGDSLSPSVPVALPDRCNIYNFARADINNDRSEETIVIDSGSRLLVLNSAGDQIWRGDNLFGATTNAFEGKVEDRRYNQVEYFAIPTPIVITDLNKDGIAEIVVSRSTDTLGSLMPSSLKYFDKGEIISLSWDQMGMIENWKTREISGMVTSVRIADLNGDGTPELIAGLVLARDFLKLGEAKSTIFSYDLNVSQAKPQKQ